MHIDTKNDYESLRLNNRDYDYDYRRSRRTKRMVEDDPIEDDHDLRSRLTMKRR
ncbi:hypothetical protein WN48_09452 [Eufriesea mexicana]|uniref:Uncharacterized protein n=1 Tax=Eufriesea mexicana TaxID=516756 RepID=A0A310SAM1_9HYME|nr:hypothetical protein WN48_09452 [Eufriesea mexicana]